MARLDANVLNYVLWSIDYHELTRIAHRKRSVQQAIGNAIEQMVIPRLWGFALSQGKHIDSDYSIWCQTWSISRCYPVRDKPQSVSIGDGTIGRIVVPFVTIVLKICMVFPVRYLARRVAWWKASGHSGPCFAADSHEFVRAGFCADCNFGEFPLG